MRRWRGNPSLDSPTDSDPDGEELDLGDTASAEVLEVMAAHIAATEGTAAQPESHRLRQLEGEWKKLWKGQRSVCLRHMLKKDEGIVVLSLFGGIGAELEALLRAGVPVRKYYYVENDPVARRVMEYRVRRLHEKYPMLLPKKAVEGFLTALPADIRNVGPRELERIGQVDLITCSSPCQGLSRANRQAQGLADSRSALIVYAFRIILHIAGRQEEKPGYIFEMVHAADHQSAAARWAYRTMERFCGGIASEVPGAPEQRVWTVIDAAKLGSPAHRVRAFGTNLCPHSVLQREYEAQERPANNWDAQRVLNNGRKVQLSPITEGSPQQIAAGQYPVNKELEPLVCFPTLVSHHDSYAWRFNHDKRGPGMIWDANQQLWTVPNADERERIMGMLPGSTRAPDVSEGQRRQLIGSAIDVRVYTWLVREVLEWDGHTPFIDD